MNIQIVWICDYQYLFPSIVHFQTPNFLFSPSFKDNYYSLFYIFGQNISLQQWPGNEKRGETYMGWKEDAEQQQSSSFTYFYRTAVSNTFRSNIFQ